MSIAPAALRRRVASVMVSFGVHGYTVRVGRPTVASWAHCNFMKRELVFSAQLLDTDWVFVNQIILHEVAHALAGVRAGHGKKWRDTARGMGYRLGAKVPYSNPQREEYRWAVTCEIGLHSAMRHDKTFEDGAMKCGKCNDEGGGDVLLFWERL
jgi:predicted SprT family Zn-dependent metalloprotease